VIHKKTITELLETLDKKDIETILPKEKRKTWRPTDTESDYTDRSGEGAHQRAAGALMWLDPRKRRSFMILQQQGISVSDEDLLQITDDTTYNFNVTPDDINTAVLVSNWRRLKVRQLWQDSVYSNKERKEYWSNTYKVRCIHGLGLFTKSGESANNSIDVALQKFKNFAIRSQQGNQAELSCIGITESSAENYSSPGLISIEFTKRKIVWASAQDGWTQFLSSADADTRNYFQIRKEIEDEDNPLAEKIFGAALVKFPGKTKLHDSILFSESDVNKMSQPFIAETIIKDWSFSPDDVVVTIARSVSNEQRERAIEEIQQIAIEFFGPNEEFLIDAL
jgi:hypothetical protein